MTEANHIRPLTKKTREGRCALLGYSAESMEAADKLGYDFVCVVPPGFETLLEKDGVKAIAWDFNKINQDSHQLATRLIEMGVTFSVPLYEECVEWAGAINARINGNPKLFNRALLFRDKAMMKRKAQMSGIRVGVFEEVRNRDEVHEFFKRVSEALATLDGDTQDCVHLKPVQAAGSLGHRVIRSTEDIDAIPSDAFPCMVESHLSGQEFSCEAFVHGGKVQFININEYIRLGHYQITPATTELAKHRPMIRKAVEKLVSAFHIDFGMIHPEYFIDAEGDLNFGEVAARVPGGHIFELIQRAYGFNPYAAFILCSDPKVDPAELREFFPDEQTGALGYAANSLVYPKKKFVKELDVPKELLDDPDFERHNMFQPITSKVAEHAGFGAHYGTVFFFGPDGERLKEKAVRWGEYDFYV